jgi:hypothetical protein
VIQQPEVDGSDADGEKGREERLLEGPQRDERASRRQEGPQTPEDGQKRWLQAQLVVLHGPRWLTSFTHPARRPARCLVP